MASTLKTPGIYIEEKNTFGKSVVAGSSAIPVFIGFTEQDHYDGSDLSFQTIKINSLNQYKNIFGGRQSVDFEIEEGSQKNHDFEIKDKKWVLKFKEDFRYVLPEHLELFFANGGAEAYVVSLGSFYRKETAKNDKGQTLTTWTIQKLSKELIEKGLESSKKINEISLVVLPDLINFRTKEATVIQQMVLKHCGYEMKNRFALLDVPKNGQGNEIDSFREGVGTEFLAFGAAYYPWLKTLIYKERDLNPAMFMNAKPWKELLNEAVLKEKKQEEGAALMALVNKTLQAKQWERAHDLLYHNLKWYKNMITKALHHLNLLNPSGAIAGIYARTDQTKGVWKSPANTGVNAVEGPQELLSSKDQEQLNVHVSGKSINAIRYFKGEGTIVWGARTLDGNSRDWRYINVRRTMIYLEEAIHQSIRPYVFESNNANTWVLVKSMISSFLLDLWKQGGLAGANASEAFEVQLGLGSTMSNEDVLDGIMRIEIKVALLRPAEFIVITFQQKMQES